MFNIESEQLNRLTTYNGTWGRGSIEVHGVSWGHTVKRGQKSEKINKSLTQIEARS